MQIVKSTLAAAAFIALTAGVTTKALAKDTKTLKIGAIEIQQPWTRATPTGSKVAGGFMRIRNTGAASDHLVGGSLTKAGHVEIHEMKMESDIMKMREIPGGLEIKPGATVTLKPGGYHVMFMQLKEPLKKGETVTGTLKFKNAGTVNVTYKVQSMGSKGGMKHGSHSGHGMKK
ncbi:MAG: copper chaperone PCu(A)C [Hyphomicrobiaceae bacterium]|nr:copper chaperone PCu(A)C [Hyphomicrobiaceae bacterium]